MFKDTTKRAIEYTRKNRAGFTLIEALAVIFVIGMISVILIINWRKNESQYKLQRAAQQIAQNVRKAQEMALAGTKFTTVPQNFGLFFMVASPSYNIFYETGNNRTYDRGSDPLVDGDAIDLGTGIEISSVTVYRSQWTSVAYATLTFSVPDGFVTIRADTPPPWQGSITVTIRNIGTTCSPINCRTIVVNQTGSVEVN